MVEMRIIGLWSHPRSVSTSIERCFRERGDCRCHHEPFMYYYYLERQRALYPNFNPEEGRPRTWQDIATMLSSPAADGEPPHIFFKDMSYYIDNRLDDLEPFLRQTVPIFLIRDPRFSLASYARLDPAFSLAEAGLEAQWQQHEWFRHEGITPMVIEAETINANPEQSVRAMCDFAGLPFIRDALTWDSTTIPADWYQVSAWHQSSMDSTGFSAPDERDPDRVFEKAAAAVPHLREYLRHQWPYYKNLRALAWQP